MTKPTFAEERKLWETGYEHVAGVDEVGRGCFAGPVVVGAVIFPKGFRSVGLINDSKKLSAKVRQKASEIINQTALCLAIAEIPVTTINTIGIGKATQVGFAKAVELLSTSPHFVLIDAFYIDGYEKTKQKPIVKGDSLCASIAAASIVAKVYRDKLMEQLHDKYLNYNFAKNKGYGTADHRKALKQYGLCDLHRTSFDLRKFL